MAGFNVDFIFYRAVTSLSTKSYTKFGHFAAKEEFLQNDGLNMLKHTLFYTVLIKQVL